MEWIGSNLLAVQRYRLKFCRKKVHVRQMVLRVAHHDHSVNNCH